MGREKGREYHMGKWISNMSRGEASSSGSFKINIAPRRSNNDKCHTGSWESRALKQCAIMKGFECSWNRLLYPMPLSLDLGLNKASQICWASIFFLILNKKSHNLTICWVVVRLDYDICYIRSIITLTSSCHFKGAVLLCWTFHSFH